MTAIPGETALDLTTNTSSLVKQMQSHDNALIVTTIQKMNNAVNNSKYKGLLTSYHDKRVIFIEDEAHRSQFGEMRKNVNKWFANSQHFGFTGTPPIFSQNIGSDKRTNETLYDEESHRYLIKDAIRDHNVLGFNVEQMSTLVGKDDISDENIDILIVVGMFLTGFDSPRLSVLYTDKKLQWHSLIQAYSRTNRVEKDTKPFGSIVNYRNLKKAADDAITLFSAGDESSFYVKQYDELLSELNEYILQLHKIVERPQDVDELYNQGEDVLSTFVVVFRDVMRTYNQIRVYDDFEWSDVDSFTDQDLESFQGKYQEVYHQIGVRPKKDKTSILEDIDFQIDLLSIDRIDVQYIVNLVKAINLDNKDSRQADVNKIKRLLDKATTDELKSKADLIAAFLDEMVPTL